MHRAAKGDRQLGTLLIDDSTRDILLLAPHIMITGLVVAPGETAARILADVHRRCELTEIMRLR